MFLQINKPAVLSTSYIFLHYSRYYLIYLQEYKKIRIDNILLGYDYIYTILSVIFNRGEFEKIFEGGLL